MKYLILIIFGTMSGLASLPVFASENEANDITQVETFTPATLLETAAPNYPRINQRKGQEGWVEVNFMVDPNGKPYDITVADSSQNPHFEKEAIRAVEKFSFEPAQLGATKIDSGAAHRVTFELVDRHGKRNKGARRKFVTVFRKFDDAILNKDQTKAGTLLEKLEAADRNIYEETYLHLARYRYAQQWQSTWEQFKHLRRAAIFDLNRDYLNPKLTNQLLETQLGLALQLNKLSQALVLVKRLRGRNISGETENKLNSVVTAIQAVGDNNVPVTSLGEINHTNRFFHRLYYNKFSIGQVKGDVAELHLHCDKGYKGFIFDPNLSYQVHKDWKNCNLIAIGNPDSTFKIVEEGI